VKKSSTHLHSPDKETGSAVKVVRLNQPSFMVTNSGAGSVVKQAQKILHIKQDRIDFADKSMIPPSQESSPFH